MSRIGYSAGATYALARIAASGRYYPAESALVRLALASYADAHAT